MAYLNVQMSQASKDTGKQVLRGLGALVFVVAIVWVGMQSFRVLPNVRQLFANAFVSVQSFFSPAERIVVSVTDSQVVIEEPFSLTWEHRGKETDGSYTMLYECHDGVHFARVVATNESTLFCNTEIPLLSNETTLTLVPYGDIEGVVEIPVSVRFTRNGTSVVSEEGQTSVVVQDKRFDTGTATSTDSNVGDDTKEDDESPTTPETPTTPRPAPRPGTPTTTRTIPIVTQPSSDPNGDIDLAVRVIAIGLVDEDSGRFTERNRIPEDLPNDMRGAIKFEVTNIGTKRSGDDWNFSVKLPTNPSHTYTSPSQTELYPGDRMEYVIGFDRVRNANEAEYTITVDPRDELDESNERNNTITREIDIDRD